MHVLMLTTRLFGQPQSGGEICSARLLAMLGSLGHTVSLVGRGDAQEAGAAHGVQAHSLGPVVTPFEALKPAARLALVASSLLRAEPLTVHRLGRQGAPASVKRLLPQLPPARLMVVDHLQSWSWLRRCRLPLPPAVLVMHNVESQGHFEQAGRCTGMRRAAHGREARLLSVLERDALGHAAALACLSEEDADLLRPLTARGVPVSVLPGFGLAGRATLPGDFDATVQAGDDRPPQAARQAWHIGMIGTWTWAPNRDALVWMLTEVLPHLGPGCRLLLAGGGLDAGLPVGLPAAQAAQVQVLGRVDDVTAFYRQLDLIAVPSLHGSGVQEKAIEAITSGLPVAATPHALRGLGSNRPDHVRCSADPVGFARICMDQAPRPGSAVLASARHWSDGRARAYRQTLADLLDAAVQVGQRVIAPTIAAGAPGLVNDASQRSGVGGAPSAHGAGCASAAGQHSGA